MGAAALEVAVILMLVVVNGLLAGSEIAIVSSRRARLRRRAESGERGAARALELASTPNRFLPTVQIGITSVAVAAGAFGGARVAGTVAPVLAAAGLPSGLAAQLAVMLVVLAITYVTLVVGELVPKRIALNDPESVSAKVAGPMHALSVVATPLVRLLGASTDFVLRFIPLRKRDEAEITEEEIRGMVAHATETGVLEATEQRIVERLFRLSDTTVGMLMTPRDRVIWLDLRGDPASWRARMGEVRHSRYVVGDGALDRDARYVSTQELLRRELAGEPFELEPALRSPHIVPEWTPAFRLLELFQWSSDHIALVTGPTGEVVGLATLNDLLEGIVGEIPELHEITRPGVIQREDGTWLVDGLLTFREFAAAFDVPGDNVPADATLHAFVVQMLDHPPRLAAAFHWNGLRIEIVDMDGSRVDKLLVSR
jgi:putative hemolysin